METTEIQQTQQEQPVLQPDAAVEQRYDPSASYSIEEAPQSTDEEPIIKEDAKPEEVAEVIDWQQKYAELESRGQQVQYVVPDELKAAILDPDTFKDIVLIQTMSAADAYKYQLQAANPWATTEDDLDALIRKDFPDYDPEIPENYGMDATDLKRFNFMADGQKSKMLSDATAQLEEKVNSFVPTPIEQAPFDEKAFEAALSKHIDESIAAYKAPEIPTIEGFDLKATVDMAKVREMAAGAANGPFFVNAAGELLPDVNAIADRLLLNQIREQLKPMADTLLRKAPDVTKDAIVRSLNNTQAPIPASGPDPSSYQTRNSGRYEGVGIASVGT